MQIHYLAANFVSASFVTSAVSAEFSLKACSGHRMDDVQVQL